MYTFFCKIETKIESLQIKCIIVPSNTFDAIHLHREHPEASVMHSSENKFDGILPYMVKRAGKILFKKKE